MYSGGNVPIHESRWDFSGPPAGLSKPFFSKPILAFKGSPGGALVRNGVAATNSDRIECMSMTGTCPPLHMQSSSSGFSCSKFKQQGIAAGKSPSKKHTPLNSNHRAPSAVYR